MNKNVKSYLKILGIESLFMLLVSLAAGLTCAIQLAGRQFMRISEGTIVSLTYYNYNSFMFITGMVLFWAASIFLYKKIYEKNAKQLTDYGIALRIGAWIVILLWGFVMFGTLVITGLYSLGLNVKMEPSGFLEIVIFGRPIAAVVLLGIDLIFKAHFSKKG